MSTPPLSAQDLRAAAEAHRELGPEYSDAIVDSFLEKIETRLEARLDARLAEVEPPRKQPVAKLTADQRRGLLTGVAIGAGGLGVPLSIMAYNATQIYSGGGRDFWAAIMVACAATGGAGLARVFRRH